jgi:hypothetical protein
MSHVRTQIRAAAVLALAPLGGVHASRLYALQPAELPALLVYTADEEIEGDFDLQQRALDLVVEIVVAGPSFDAAIDDQLIGVEKLLTGTLSGLCVSVVPVSISVSASPEGQTPIGRARVVFRALYRTSYTDPETAI